MSGSASGVSQLTSEMSAFTSGVNELTPKVSQLTAKVNAPDLGSQWY